MNISISEQHGEHIKRKVESGIYRSPDDVIAKALELLDEHDEELERELADMRLKVKISTEQADAGQLIPASEVFDELRRRNAAIARQKQ
ncbi:MAG: type II toxin-antitoxin system ParD family antitoxin [Chloroflexi bacterium]|nr:type II toxin-antitoxin system ParD family antitoxin [Chloroflexota bacterium]